MWQTCCCSTRIDLKTCLFSRLGKCRILYHTRQQRQQPALLQARIRASVVRPSLPWTLRPSRITLSRTDMRTPATIPSGHVTQGRFPRHGEAVASEFYAPGALIHQPLGSFVPVTTVQPSVNSKGHALSTTTTFYIQNALGYFRNVVSNISDTGLASAATTFLNAVESGAVTTYGSAGTVNAAGYFIADEPGVLASYPGRLSLYSGSPTAVVGGSSGCHRHLLLRRC